MKLFLFFNPVELTATLEVNPPGLYQFLPKRAEFFSRWSRLVLFLKVSRWSPLAKVSCWSRWLFCASAKLGQKLTPWSLLSFHQKRDKEL